MSRIPREEKRDVIITRVSTYLRIIAANPGITSNELDALANRAGAGVNADKYMKILLATNLVENCQEDVLGKRQKINHWYISKELNAAQSDQRRIA